MSYQFNPESARSGDNTSSRITESGAYTGIFTRAESVVSEKGTAGIEFTFEATDKRSADFLTLWTINAEGKEIYGHKQLMALMACLKLRAITEKEAMVEKFINGQRGKVKAKVYPELMGRPIGVLLQREPYEKRDGSTGNKFNLYGFFDPASRLTATEILDRATKPERLDKMIASLKDKPMQARRGAAPTSAAPTGPAPNGDDFDDIPFD